MSTFLIILAIHAAELIIVLGYLLIRKNRKLEKALIENQQYISILSSTISASKQRLEEIDVKGTFSSDDEIGWFFQQIKGIQESLDEFIVK
jgi:hypothetical protein